MVAFVKSLTSLIEYFVASSLSLFQFLMTSFEFTDYFPGSNKVHYPISDGKDFTLVFTSVVGGKIILTYDA